MRSLRLAILGAAALYGSSANAAITFTFDFSQNAQGIGFLDPTYGAARQQALVTAGNLFSNIYGKYFTNSANLTFAAVGTNGRDANGNPDSIANAGTAGISAPGFGNGEVVRNVLISNGLVDLNGAGNDGFVSINFANDFQLDPNAAVNFAGGQFDLYSIIDHEFTHAIGFGSNINEAGDTPGSYSKWDQFLTDKMGNRVVDPLTGLVNHAGYSSAQTIGGLFNGPNADAAFPGGVPLVINTDISHLDTHTFSSPNVPQNALMLCCGGENISFEPRDYNSSEVGILADIGYTRRLTGAVPEPASWAMFITGFGLIGATMRRRKVAASVA